MGKVVAGRVRKEMMERLLVGHELLPEASSTMDVGLTPQLLFSYIAIMIIRTAYYSLL